MQEQVFLSEGGVTVTQARFIVPGQTYAIQGITSVAHNVVRPSKKWPIILMIVGIIIALISFGMLPDSSGIVMLLVGFAAIGLGVLWFRALKADHLVVLNSSTTTSSSRTVTGGFLGFRAGAAVGVTNTAGENFMIALSNKDGEFIGRVVAALNDAIAARG